LSIPGLLGLLTLVVGVPLNLYLTIRLWRVARANPDLRVLRERAITASAVLLLVLVFGLIFLNNDAIPPWLAGEQTKLLTRLAMFLASVAPAAYWLWLYRPGDRGGS